MEMSALAVGLILGAIGGLWVRGPTMDLDESILFVYVAPGAAAGVFVATAGVLCFRRMLSLPVLVGAMLGAAVGTGSSAWAWRHVLEPVKFEPPGGDVVFMLVYFGLFSLSGIVVGAVAARTGVSWLKEKLPKSRQRDS